MSRLSGYRDNETGDARANVRSPHLQLLENLVTIGSLATHQILAKLVNRILRCGDGGGCMCARAELPRPTHDLW